MECDQEKRLDQGHKDSALHDVLYQGPNEGVCAITRLVAVHQVPDLLTSASLS